MRLPEGLDLFRVPLEANHVRVVDDVHHVPDWVFDLAGQVEGCGGHQEAVVPLHAAHRVELVRQVNGGGDEVGGQFERLGGAFHQAAVAVAKLRLLASGESVAPAGVVQLQLLVSETWVRHSFYTGIVAGRQRWERAEV